MNLKEKCLSYLKTKNMKLDKSHASLQSVSKIVCDDCKNESGDDKLYIKGYITTFGNTDREGDIVDEKAFNSTIKELRFVPILRNHINKTQDQMGLFTTFGIDSEGVYAEGFISNTPETQHERKLIKDGALNSFSMGGLCRYEKNVIKEVALLEASIVAIPANEKAKFTIKSILEKSEEVPLEEPKESLKKRIDRLKKKIRRT